MNNKENEDIERILKKYQRHLYVKEFLTQSFYTSNILPIPKNHVTMIYGQGGIGKSYLGLCLALNYIKQENDYAFIWDADGLGDYEINERYRQILKNDKDSNKILEKLLINTDTDTSDLDDVLNELKKVPVKFIIIDPLISFFDGKDENDNVAARSFITKFTSFAKKEEATIIIIHHTSKNKRTTARGASEFVNAVRASYQVEKCGEKLMVKLKKENLGMSKRFGTEFHISLSTGATNINSRNIVKSRVC